MSYTSLLKRLEMLEHKTTTRSYEIEYTTDYFPIKSQVYKTPDEALETVYEDAHKHGVKNLHVRLWPWDTVSLVGNYIGYTWKVTGGNPWKLREYEINTSNILPMDCYFLCRTDPIAYPNPKPEFEVLDLLRIRESEWCQQACHKTVEEWKESWSDQMRNIRKGKTEVEGLEEVYREAGYDLPK